MQADDYGATTVSDSEPLPISEFLLSIRRRWPLLVLPTIAGTALTLYFVLSLPSVYRSTGTVLIESAQVPENFVPSTITSFVEERIQVIRQRVMTRSNLLAIIEKFGLFGSGKDKPASELVDTMRGAVTINSMSGEEQAGAGTIAFTVSFDHTNARTAQAVANELVTTFLNENARNRTQRVSEAKAFLAQEADRLNRRLDQIETEIAAYKTRYGDLLGTQASGIGTQITNLQQSLRENYIQEQLLQDRRAEIGSQIAVLAKGGRIGSGMEQQLLEAQAKLRDARSRFTEDHPEVVYQMRQVESIKEEMSAAQKQDGSKPRPESELQFDPAYLALQFELKSIDNQVRMLTEQRRTAEADVKKLQDAREKIPTVDKGLTGLERDYQNTLAKYRDIKAKEMQAQLAENLESERMGERFSLIEPPALPDTPIRPKRQLLAAMGIGGSFVLGAILLVVAELLSGGVRRTRQLRQLVGYQVPVIAVPYLPSSRDSLVGTVRSAVVGGLLAGSIVATGYIVHTRYQPLDVLWLRFAQVVETKLNKLPFLGA